MVKSDADRQKRTRIQTNIDKEKDKHFLCKLYFFGRDVHDKRFSHTDNLNYRYNCVVYKYQNIIKKLDFNLDV